MEVVALSHIHGLLRKALWPSLFPSEKLSKSLASEFSHLSQQLYTFNKADLIRVNPILLFVKFPTDNSLPTILSPFVLTLFRDTEQK